MADHRQPDSRTARITRHHLCNGPPLCRDLAKRDETFYRPKTDERVKTHNPLQSASIRFNPHDTSAKVELARLLIEKRHFDEALPLLEVASKVMPDSAEVIYDLGYCLLKCRNVEEGETLILKALQMNPRIRYGEPYLRLGEAFASTAPDKAMRYLEEFRMIQSSSIEGYYQLGQLYASLGKKEEAKLAYREALEIYRGLPKYKKRTERKWAWMSRLKQ